MTDSKSLTAACVLALGKMRAARLADYGSFPKTDAALLEMAEVYAEALAPDPDLPGDPLIDVQCVVNATNRIVRDPSSAMPSAGAFREMCGKEWHLLYRFAGKDVYAPDGTSMIAFAQVRRDAPKESVDRSLMGKVDEAKARGLVESIPALPESASEIRPVSFRPVPRESTETEADHEARRLRNQAQIERLRSEAP